MMTSRVIMKVLLVVLGILGMTRAKSVATYDQRQEGKVNVQIDVKDVQIVALVDSEMLDDYTNYDYAYDYADFTIKPSSRPTTGKPPSTAGDISPSSSTSSSHEETWSTWPTNPSSSVSTPSADSSTPESSSPSSDETLSTKAPEVSSTVPADESLPATIAVALVHHNPSEDESKKIVEGVSNASKLEAEKQQQIQSELSTSTTTAAATAADEIKPDGPKRPAGIAEPRKRCPVGFLLKSGKCFKRRYSLISPRLALMKLAPALLSKSNILSGIPAAAAAASAPSS